MNESKKESSALTTFEAYKLIKMEKKLANASVFKVPTNIGDTQNGNLDPVEKGQPSLFLRTRINGRECDDKFTSMIMHPYANIRLIALDIGKTNRRHLDTVDGKKVFSQDAHLHIYTQEQGDREHHPLSDYKAFKGKMTHRELFFAFLTFCNIINRADIDQQGEFSNV